MNLPGPQSLVLLGNYSGETERPFSGPFWTGTQLVGGLFTIWVAWQAYKAVFGKKKNGLRSNPARGAWSVKTPYSVAMEEYLEAEERGVSQSELKRLWRCVQKAREYGRKYPAGDPERWVYSEEC